MSGHTTARSYHWLLALLPLGLALYFVSLLGRVAAGDFPHWSAVWMPDLNVSFDLHMDGLGWLMAVVVSGMGTLILTYASGYMAGDPAINRFFAILIGFMLAMLGVVLADNIILLFVFWELTSITSYMLIGFKHETEKGQKSALQALLVTGAGGLCLLAGLILLGVIGKSWNLSTLLQQGDLFRDHPLYLPITILILLGCFTKSAQFPFHFWLPNAMAAPTPVSAFLHSATMVKAGVYLLARLNPILGGTELWFYTLVLLGGFTGLLGAWLSWQQTDLKRILAYSTISALGTLVFLIGLGNEVAAKAAVLFLVVHSLYKGALFMTAGAIDHATGTRDVTQLGGLRVAMPFTFAGVLLGALSMSGFPPLLGFVGKELIYEAAVTDQLFPVVVTGIALLTNILIVASAGVVLFEPFVRTKPTQPAHPHEVNWQMWVGPLVLGAFSLLLSIFIETPLVNDQIFTPAVHSLAGEPIKVSLHLIPVKWNIVPLLSLMTLVLGGAWYAFHGRVREQAQKADQVISRFGPEQGYFKGLDGLLGFAKDVTLTLQNGNLRYYIMTVFVVLSGLLAAGLWPMASNWPTVELTNVYAHEAILALVMMAATALIATTRSRLTAVLGLGVVGYGIALLYILYGAPDLAMTQFAIETLSVILFVLVLYRLPRFETLTHNWARARDFVVASAVGGLMALLVWSNLAIKTAKPLTQYFAETSYEIAYGRNVVNVILVDYRGADTLVEITVLSVAAIGVYALVRGGATAGQAIRQKRKKV